MYTRVAALDAETGAELWAFDPRAYEGGPKGAGPSGFKHRDVEYSNNCPYGATLVMLREAGGPGAAQTPQSRLGPIPLIKPPYAHLVAIDLDTGEIAWKVPFGEGSRAVREHPLLRGVELPERLGTRGNAGPIVAKGGLVFLGGGDPYLYAFDTATGAELWRGATQFRTNGIPMTYRARSGRQIVAIATGSGPGAALVAFARPEQGTRTNQEPPTWRPGQDSNL